MVNDVSIERLFSMPAFEGLRTIRLQSLENVGLPIIDLISIVKRVDSDAQGFDFEAAVILHEIVSPEISCDGIGFYQHCISGVLLNKRPIWSRMITLGRGRFIKKLDRDEQSIFRQAGLLIDPPTDEVIKWWDTIKGKVRLEGDQAKLVSARKAEKLSLVREENRLIKIGIYEKPKWMAIDDDTAGYDVLSYEKNAFGLINKLIEVKSTVASPLRFFLTRHEWDQALIYREAYCFHIWDMQKDPPILYEKKVSEIEPHIPEDNKKGKWKLAEIPVGL